MRLFSSSRTGHAFVVAFWFLTLVFVFTACSSSSPPEVRTYYMGDRVELGHLVYTVFETRWLTQIGEGPSARVPQNRFFLIRLSVGNTSSREMLVPNMTIEDDKGNTYPELTDGDGVPQFLAVLRPVTIADAAAGNALFDAPPGHYKLHIADEENERLALVDIPLSFRSDVPEVPSPEGAPK
jgi:hypothetical protein